VKAEYRHRGYGQLLLKTFVDLCGNAKLFTSTNSSNLPMQGLLQRCGFRRCGTIDELDEGDPEIIYFYEKPSIYKPEALKTQAARAARDFTDVEIVPMDVNSMNDINKPNQSFLVFGKIIPSYINGKWMWTEEALEKPYQKRYPEEPLDYFDYVESPDKIMYLAYIGSKCVGRIRLRHNWNKYCYIEDLMVCSKHRKHGIGTKLIDIAVEWAKKGGMLGLMLETQDNNLVACRFYHKCGFKLGAVDIYLYANFQVANEKALFWYKRFDG
jgi:streptothricin acetyltransferase